MNEDNIVPINQENNETDIKNNNKVLHINIPNVESNELIDYFKKLLSNRNIQN